MPKISLSTAKRSATPTRRKALAKPPFVIIDEVEAPHLSPVLANGVGNSLRRAQLTVFQDLARRLKRYHLRPVHLGLMDIIARHSGLRQSQAGDALGVKKANFVALLDELVDLGLTRRTVGTDRRSYALYLTEKGEALFPKLWLLMEEHERLVRQTLGEKEERQLLRLLDKLSPLANNGADSPP